MSFESPDSSSNARASTTDNTVLQFYIEGLPVGLIRLQALLLACVGLTKGDDNTKPLFDPNISPWRDLYPSLKNLEQKHYMKEIERRYDYLLVAAARDPKTTRPRPNQWTLADLKKHLLKHPHDDPDDIVYLNEVFTHELTQATHQLLNKTTATVSAATANKGRSVESKKKGVNWTSNIPFLRLIHCLVDNEDIRDAYIKRYVIHKGRHKLDNRKSVEKRPEDVHELLAKCWNDEDFTCTTLSIYGAPKDSFRYPIVIDHSIVKKYTAATPEMIKDKIKMMNRALTRSHAGWIKSGEGEGSRKQDGIDSGIEDNDDIDGVDDDASETEIPSIYQNPPPPDAIDWTEKGKYVDKKYPYILYFWYMNDTYQLFDSSVQRLHSNVATGQLVGGTTVPGVLFGRSTTSSMKDVLGSSGGLSVGEQSTAANFALAESVSSMADSQRYVGELEAANRDKDRNNSNERHLRDIAIANERHLHDIACQQRAQDVQVYTQQQQSRIAIASRADTIMAAIDLLHTEKRKLEIQVAELEDDDDLHLPKRKKTKIDLLKKHIEIIDRQTKAKEDLVQSLLDQRQQPDILTPSRRGKTPDSAAVGRTNSTLESDKIVEEVGHHIVVNLQDIQKDLMPSFTE